MSETNKLITLKEFFEKDVLCKDGDILKTNDGNLLIVKNPVVDNMYACVPLYGDPKWRIWWMVSPTVRRIEKDYNVSVSEKCYQANGLKSCTIIRNDVTGVKYIFIKSDKTWAYYNLSDGTLCGMMGTDSPMLMHCHMTSIFGDLSKYSIVSAP